MEEIDLYDLLRFYAKKWLTIATFVMIGGILGVVYTFFVQTPQYTSKAQLLLVGNTRASASDAVVLNNYVQLFTSHRVLGRVADAQRYDKGYEALAAQTTAENVKNTDIINVAISTSDAKQSRALLENSIESFRKEAKALYGDNNVKINVVDGASVPASPTNIKPVMQIGLSVAAGFALAIISLFFVYDYRASRRGKEATNVSTDAPVEPTSLDKPAQATQSATYAPSEEIIFGVSTEEAVRTETLEQPESKPEPEPTPAPKKAKKPRKSKKSTKKD